MRIAAVALLAVALATGCGSSDEQTATPPQATTSAAPPASASTRKPAPPLSGESLDGERIALGDFRGRPLLINVWSSW
jgi:cytochrome oxidase Cu insertion factor (SCO1/SenC/PrrC family)